MKDRINVVIYSRGDGPVTQPLHVGFTRVVDEMTPGEREKAQRRNAMVSLRQQFKGMSRREARRLARQVVKVAR